MDDNSPLVTPFPNDKMIGDLETMKILEEEDEKVEYVVIKIGDRTYSTSFCEIKSGKDIDIAKKQLVVTKGIGKQLNLWIKGFFTETEDHNKLSSKVPFEINIYTEKGK